MPWNFLPVLHMQDRKMWMTIQCMCIYSHYHLYHLINPYFMDEDFHWLQGRTVLSSKSNAWRTETKNCNVISVCVRRINMDKGCQSPKIASLCCYFFFSAKCWWNSEFSPCYNWMSCWYKSNCDLFYWWHLIWGALCFLVLPCLSAIHAPVS